MKTVFTLTEEERQSLWEQAKEALCPAVEDAGMGEEQDFFNGWHEAMTAKEMFDNKNTMLWQQLLTQDGFYRLIGWHILQLEGNAVEYARLAEMHVPLDPKHFPASGPWQQRALWLLLQEKKTIAFAQLKQVAEEAFTEALTESDKEASTLLTLVLKVHAPLFAKDAAWGAQFFHRAWHAGQYHYIETFKHHFPESVVIADEQQQTLLEKAVETQNLGMVQSLLPYYKFSSRASHEEQHQTYKVLARCVVKTLTSSMPQEVGIKRQILETWLTLPHHKDFKKVTKEILSLQDTYQFNIEKLWEEVIRYATSVPNVSLALRFFSLPIPELKDYWTVFCEDKLSLAKELIATAMEEQHNPTLMAKLAEQERNEEKKAYIDSLHHLLDHLQQVTLEEGMPELYQLFLQYARKSEMPGVAMHKDWVKLLTLLKESPQDHPKHSHYLTLVKLWLESNAKYSISWLAESDYKALETLLSNETGEMVECIKTFLPVAPPLHEESPVQDPTHVAPGVIVSIVVPDPLPLAKLTPAENLTAEEDFTFQEEELEVEEEPSSFTLTNLFTRKSKNQEKESTAPGIEEPWWHKWLVLAGVIAVGLFIVTLGLHVGGLVPLVPFLSGFFPHILLGATVQAAAEGVVGSALLTVTAAGVARASEPETAQSKSWQARSVQLKQSSMKEKQ